MFKTSHLILKAPLVILIFCTQVCFAGNSSYITLSNQIARRIQLETVANNVANSNTIGYEAETLLFRNIDVKQPTKSANSFVYAEGMYKREDAGTLKVTDRPLDLAIGGKGYFKVLTPAGPRYTLNGSILINSGYVLVNSQGFPFASRTNQPIIIPVDTQDIQVSQDGTINARPSNDNFTELDIIGVFDIEDYNQLVKESNSLYNNKSRDILLDEYTIISGALRDSNVSSTKAMTDMVELQRSAGITNNLMSDLAGLERSLITKIAK